MGRKKKSFGGWIIFILLTICIGAAYYGYRQVFGPALQIKSGQVAFYIPSGWSDKEVYNDLIDRGIVTKPKALRWVMNRKNYDGSLVVSGKYILKDGMSANTLIDYLRAGNGEEEVKIIITPTRTVQELAGKAAANIEADSVQILDLITDPEVARQYGFNSRTFISMFLPDTYRAEWDTDANEFIARMATEYKKFWNEKRKQEAAELGLSQSEVSTLASIVQAEQQSHPEERPIIAGLYLNRLRRGMRLQSDPTVVYAIGDFSINRVLTKQLSVDSPYNTYIHSGLPPGPINIPSKQAIDAVLNADQNDFIFMCAKADFSGFHAFAKNHAQHIRNANAFQNALNQREIYR